MIPPLHRLVVMALASVLLISCTSWSTLDSIASGEVDQFARGLDRYIATGNLEPLRQVARVYPDGYWKTRAEAIIALAEQQAESQEKLRKLAEQQEECRQQSRRLADCEESLTACRREKEVLAEDIRSLEATVERLKKILLDPETPLQ